jgi:hypothetical protein
MGIGIEDVRPAGRYRREMMTTARFGLEGSAACREEGTAHPAPLYLRVKKGGVL